MKKTHRISTAALAITLCCTPLISTRAADAASNQPLVEIAILLDTSNSMDGLIDQAKGQLWKIVNQFINARQKGKTPQVHVALFEYGKTSLPSSEGHIRMIQPLTNDLDRISEDLFALKTNGGEEFCGWVIREAVNRLAWSTSPDVYRAIFIAGNEPFTQGTVNYADACKAAIAKGIIVNTIHCGSREEGVKTQWSDGALLADGMYMTIDQSKAVVHFEAPQDKEIARLGTELNKTYVAFGRAGTESATRQTLQDQNASLMSSSGAPVNRAIAKASANYFNGSWDLVDAVKNGDKLAEIKKEDLPVEMQKMTEAERESYLATKAGERADIQKKIQQLNADRNKYLAEQQKTHSATNTLDSVMIATLREQASKKNYQFE